jgi:hypothetical protein
MPLDEQTLADAKQALAAKKKEFEQAKTAKDQAAKAVSDAEAQLAAAQTDFRAADMKEQNAQKALDVADALVQALSSLLEAQAQQADFEEKDRDYRQAECSGASKDTLDVLKKKRDDAEKLAPKPEHLKALADAVGAQLAAQDALVKQAEWRKKLSELRNQAKGLEQRNRTALDQLSKAMVEANQASEVQRRNKIEQEDLEKKLGAGGTAGPSSAASAPAPG